MTFPQASKIYEACGYGGYISRGPSFRWSSATIKQIEAMCKRGYGSIDIEVIGRRKKVVGMTVTAFGALRAAEVMTFAGYQDKANLLDGSIPAMEE